MSHTFTQITITHFIILCIFSQSVFSLISSNAFYAGLIYLIYMTGQQKDTCNIAPHSMCFTTGIFHSLQN